ncbi:MAG TPA: hypothetical protein VEP90_23465, partial [Methylomirabilota bacterium]|nr:hypothetical protein [Methylomirabilota bacterium]
KTMESRTTQQIPISLQAFAGITKTENQRAFLNKPYYVRAGIVPDPRNMKEPIALDILIQGSDNIELLAGWYRQLNYDPDNTKSQLVEFTIRPKEVGQSTLIVDFYYEQSWLKTIKLQFESIPQGARARSSHQES